MKNIGSDKAKKEIENCHHRAELRCAVLPVNDYAHDQIIASTTKRPEAGIVDGEDDDVEEDADAVDDEGEEDGVLTVGQRDAPDQTAEEQ